MSKFFLHAAIIILLTALTQLGGLAWMIALLFKQRVLTFLLVYGLVSVSAVWVAPHFGRTALTCSGSGDLAEQSWFYCVLNRQYVTPEMKNVLEDMAGSMTAQFPGTKTRILDANFPFVTGFPLLPHLSHDDGEKADIAFFYDAPDGTYLPGAARSPIGYFAFEHGVSTCPPNWLTLRWDMKLLQPLWRKFDLDVPRNQYAITQLAADPRVGKIFVEPHLVTRLAVQGPKVRFQGCRAARHDDHIHIQL